MTYKKVPSIKSIEDKKFARDMKKVEEEQIDTFRRYFSPRGMKEFDKALKEVYNLQKPTDEEIESKIPWYDEMDLPKNREK